MLSLSFLQARRVDLKLAPQGGAVEVEVLKQLSAMELRAQPELIARLDKQPQALLLPPRKSSQSVSERERSFVFDPKWRKITVGAG